MAAVEMRSPRNSQASRPARPSMINFGSMVPRPGYSCPQQGRSPRLSNSSQQNGTPTPSSSSSGFFGGLLGALSPRSETRETRQAAPTSLIKALGTRGGVVREQDGFEVFYGVDNRDAKVKPRQPRQSKPKQDDRDGFDKFYGIQSRDRGVEESREDCTGDAAKCKDLAGNQRQLDSQLRTRLGSGGSSPESEEVGLGVQPGDGAGVAAAGAPPSRPSHKLNVSRSDGYPAAATPTRQSHEVPAGVPTFSLDVQPELPRGVETFSLCGRQALRSPRLSRESAYPPVGARSPRLSGARASQAGADIQVW